MFKSLDKQWAIVNPPELITSLPFTPSKKDILAWGSKSTTSTRFSNNAPITQAKGYVDRLFPVPPFVICKNNLCKITPPFKLII